ncbi:hypothetical protein LCGC14_0414000 [marine sediment metagenome]|uniref:Uncharacterized protein n=1 Tax=marine sediment metagenome TaxID=412755 RepID=A0A0F9SYV2_9ZZZZ
MCIPYHLDLTSSLSLPHMVLTAGSLTLSNFIIEEDVGQSTFEEFMNDHEKWVQENVMEKDEIR